MTNNKWPITLSLAFVFALLLGKLDAAPAFAQTFLNDPWGNNPSQAVVYRAVAGDHWVTWKNLNTGACVSDFLGGTSGLKGEFDLLGNGGNDVMTVVRAGTSFTFCGVLVQAPLYNGFFIDLTGQTGHDYLSCGDGDTFLRGNEGNDVLNSLRANSVMSGNTGNDTLINGAAGGSGLRLDAGENNDCVRINVNQSPTSQSCGIGTDNWSGPGTRPTSCESTSGECCPGIVC